MDPNYAMAKFGLESKSILKTKHRGCWYYTKYFFFFLSIIQFLIILGLVLFMLYGNAHVGTELRLRSVENRYKNLTHDYTLLNYNFSQLKSKLSSTEKENQNCTKILDSAMKQLGNRTKPPTIILPPPLEICRQYQTLLDRVNTTYIIETLQLKHTILILQSNYDKLKENCGQNILALSTKGNQTVSEMTKLQREKEDLEAQIKSLQTVCSDINSRFDAALDSMKRNFDSYIGSNDHLRYSNCWSIGVEIKKNIDQTIIRLKQDVNNVMYENSQMKTENVRVNNDFQKCNQEKKDIIAEKNHLSIEKGGLEKALSEKKEEIAKSFTKYMKKEEELENCRKIQLGGRIPSGGFPRI